MRSIILFTLFVLFNYPLDVFAADKGPQKAFFAYGQVKEAVYAIRTTVPQNEKRNFYLHRWVENPFVIYKLNFRESRKKLNVRNSTVEVPLEFNLYNIKIFNIDSSYDVNHLEYSFLNFTRGGVLPVEKKGLEAGNKFAFLAPGLETLRFPVFEETGMTLQRGQKYEITVPPYLVTPSVASKIFENKLKAQDLPPTIIHSHWRGWEKINGYECAVIDFSFKVKSEDKFEIGKEDGEFSLKGTSYFSLDLGLPVVNIYNTKGFMITKDGEKIPLDFHRKEVLVSVQPMDGKQITLKKEERPTDTKVDPNLPTITDKQEDIKEPSLVEMKKQPTPKKLTKLKQPQPQPPVLKTPTWIYAVIAILVAIIFLLLFALKSYRSTEKKQ